MTRQLLVNLNNLLLSCSEAVDLTNPSIVQHQQRTALIAIEIAIKIDLKTEKKKELLSLLLANQYLNIQNMPFYLLSSLFVIMIKLRLIAMRSPGKADEIFYNLFSVPILGLQKSVTKM